jgi:hypothetical protein
MTISSIERTIVLFNKDTEIKIRLLVEISLIALLRMSEMASLIRAHPE